MKKIRKFLPYVALCGGVLAVPAAAYDFDQISINGFGSIIAGQVLDSNDELYGYDDDMTMQEETRFALQVSAPIGEKFNATAQIIARGDDNYDPTFEWAYLSYQATDDFMVMAGRQRFNLYKYSDYLDVGYAYSWIRPPQGVYSLPFSSGTGVGFLYTGALGDIDYNLTYKYIGDQDDDYEPSGSTDVDPANFETTMSHLVNADLTWGDVNFGINLGHVPKLTYDAAELDALEAALGATPPGGFGLPADQVNDIMSDIRVDDEKVNFYGAYIGYDPGDWFLLTEYTYYEFDDDNAFSNQSSFYTTAGIRINEFTLHTTYGIDINSPSSDVYEKYPEPLRSLLKEAVSVQKENSNTYSAGVRWEVQSGVALKADYTGYSDDNTDNSTSLVSAGVDFVF